MDKSKPKAKTDKSNKNVDKEKLSSFVADVKTLKENLKIREILRTVKMNSSMRIKAPRGSKVMHNKDFNDNDDFEDGNADEGHTLSEPPSATNPLVVNNNTVMNEEDYVNFIEPLELESNESEDNSTNIDIIGTTALLKSKSLCEGLEDTGLQRTDELNSTVMPVLATLESPVLRPRDRKLSLDHTMLKKEALSQSEADLNSIGKSPLERKSSFFRKKMDSFLKNTTEIFKRQTSSLSGKSSSFSSRVERKGSTCSRMSVSMQSLNENEVYDGEYDGEALDTYNEEMRGSVTSLRSAATPVRSNSSVSISQSDRIPDRSLKDSLAGSQTLPDRSSRSSNNLSESFAQESFLHSRAISMSSGLDTAHGPRKRKTSRANRVTWVASESLTDYFRRLTQDEKTKEMQVRHSYQDFSTIPENNHCGFPETDSKGRRLSYQKAVLGEDPVLPNRHQDSRRRKKVMETSDLINQQTQCLAEFAKSGVPVMADFQVLHINERAEACLKWAEKEVNLQEYGNWLELSNVEESKQAVIKELLYTEADYIRHMRYVVNLYIATVNALQKKRLLLDVRPCLLFLNIPDILNANMQFWEKAFYPMIADAVENETTFKPELMLPGFVEIADILEPYDFYVGNQTRAVGYLRELMTDPEFSNYFTWCTAQNQGDKLQLADLLVKPMQRLTKYSIIIHRIASYTEGKKSKAVLKSMEDAVDAFVTQVNRAIRKRQEIARINELEKVLEPYNVDFKDEDQNCYFGLYSDTKLLCPMVNCSEFMSRAIIYEGDVRYRDNTKEVEVRAILFTDMLLICKRMSKGTYKMIRPKISLDQTILFNRYPHKNYHLKRNGLIFVIRDDHGRSISTFVISDPSKDTTNTQQFLRTWELKVREAKLAYEYSLWFTKNPVKDLTEITAEYTPENYKEQYPDSWQVERNARELVAAMMHPNIRPKDYAELQKYLAAQNAAIEPGRGPPSRRCTYQTSTEDSSRTSRFSSLQPSTSAASDNEPIKALQYLYKAGSSVEHLIPPQNPDDVARSITVNVVGDNDCETVVPTRDPSPTVLLVLQEPSPNQTLTPRSVSAGGSQNTLQVTPQQPFGNSLPNLNSDLINSQKLMPSQAQSTASEKLYRSHQELLQQNRLAASQHHQHLSPDNRGTSYPPRSPRGALQRGLAFSYSFRNNPPLSKMGHVSSQSQHNIDQEQYSTIQLQKVPARHHPAPEPVASTSAGPSTEKSEKKKSSSRKSSSKTSIPELTKDDECVTEEKQEKGAKPKKDGGNKKKSSQKDKKE